MGAARGGPDAVRVTLGQSENSRSGRSGKKSGGAIILPLRQLRYSMRRPRDIVSGRSARQAWAASVGLAWSRGAHRCLHDATDFDVPPVRPAARPRFTPHGRQAADRTLDNEPRA